MGHSTHTAGRRLSSRIGVVPVSTVTMVRNEADIIEAFVRHHLPSVKRMVLILHRPKTPNILADNTEDILQELVAEGLPIEVQVFEEARYAQREVMTNAIREAGRSQGEGWILPLDADEFLVTGGADLSQILSGFDPTLAQQIPWRTYVPTADDDLTERNPARRIQYRRQVETVRTNKVVVPARLARHERSRVSQGSHRFKIGKEALNVESNQAWLAHIPIRSADQIRTKVFQGWLNDLVHRHVSDDRAGDHWERLFREFSSRESVSPSELTDLTLDYVSPREPGDDGTLIHDPIPTIADELRYEQRPINPWAMLAAQAESMARALGLRKRSSIFSWRNTSWGGR